MRLICPNCGAQYEVPTEVIPESGRDVQCSDCGTTWFQHHPDHAPVEEEDTPPQDDHTPQTITPQDDETLWQDDEDYSSEEEDEHDGEDAAPPPPATAADAESTTPARREIDPAVADVLRQEAEYEARAREQDMRGTVETQQELGLDETDRGAKRRSEEAQARMARLRGEPDPHDPDADFDDIDPSSRSNLLPDIDEINSSLDSDGVKEDLRPAPSTETDTVVPRKGGGFRSGFRLAIILAVLALVLYVFAPQLSEAVPQLADPLSGYVNMVNSWRTGLDELMQNLAASLSGDENADS